jgi:hypothetical protein
MTKVSIHKKIYPFFYYFSLSSLQILAPFFPPFTVIVIFTQKIRHAMYTDDRPAWWLQGVLSQHLNALDEDAVFSGLGLLSLPPQLGLYLGCTQFRLILASTRKERKDKSSPVYNKMARIYKACNSNRR